MKDLFRKYRSNKRLLKQLNRCRMAVQAITLADITDSSGKELTKNALMGLKPAHRRSKLEWPTLGSIKQKYWKEWKNCLQETFCEKGTNRLTTQLGKWRNTQAQEWDTFMYRSTRTLIWRKQEGNQERWYKHGNPTKQGGSTYNVTIGIEIQRPERAVRITLKSQSKYSWVFHEGTRESTRTRERIKSGAQNHAEVCNRVTGQMFEKGRMAELARDLRNGTLIGGSDASVVKNRGTGAWMIAKSTDLSTSMEGGGPIDGNPETMHSTRAERGATIGCLWAITKMAKKYKVRKGACTLYIDNRGSYGQGRILVAG